MEFKFKKEEAIRKEVSKSGHPIYIYECTDCGKELRVRHLKRKSSKCSSCCQKKKPFTSSYSNLRYCAKKKNLELDITYKDFLEFTKIKQCHYCYSLIEWKPSKYYKYHLDRKDNDKGYLLDNCVVCCTKCNYGKSNRYTYYEWYNMTSYLRYRYKVRFDNLWKHFGVEV